MTCMHCMGKGTVPLSKRDIRPVICPLCHGTGVQRPTLAEVTDASMKRLQERMAKLREPRP